jgi:anaphase-promoting complex subunit 11
MKVTVHEWRTAAQWRWAVKDDACGICRSAFDAHCSACRLPGDDCPPVWGGCGHAFHMHCIVRWGEAQAFGGAQCPMCRREWVFAQDGGGGEGSVAGGSAPAAQGSAAQGSVVEGSAAEGAAAEGAAAAVGGDPATAAVGGGGGGGGVHGTAGEAAVEAAAGSSPRWPGAAEEMPADDDDNDADDVDAGMFVPFDAGAREPVRFGESNDDIEIDGDDSF